MCVDYTKPNETVKREYYSIPSLDETAEIGNVRVFSKLDANSGYWQMPHSLNCKDLTTFITPFGRFRCNRLPFGISSAPEIFQRTMQKVLVGTEGALCHMDDILVYGETLQQHDRRLNLVLNKLREAGLTLNKEKCEFALTSIQFLGHRISQNGISADPNKVKAIRDFPSPRSKKELRRFLGVCNYLTKFSPQLASMSKRLRTLLTKDAEWWWDEQLEKEFIDLKSLLTSTPVLHPYDVYAETCLSTDASSFGLGAAILQKHKDKWKPVAYASRSLTPTEKNYAQIERSAGGR